jgi:RNA polymerase-binding transcription factor DksA
VTVTSKHSNTVSKAQGKAETLMRVRRAELQADYEHCLAVLREPYSEDFDNGEAGDREGRAEAALMVNHLRQEIRAIDEALARLADGSFGVCIECRRRIAQGRLLAVPTARRCIRCQSRFERKAG